MYQLALNTISTLMLSFFLVDLHPGTISTANNGSLPPAAMISKPTAKDLYKSQNTFIHRMWYFVSAWLGARVQLHEEEDPATRAPKIKLLNRYKDMLMQLGTAVVGEMISSLDDYEKNRVEKEIRQQQIQRLQSEELNTESGMEDDTLHEAFSDKKIYTYGRIPSEIKESAYKSLRNLAVTRSIPTNRCRDYWLEEDILSYLYRNRKRNKKSQVLKDK